jgi:hypothetical protein
LSPLVLGELCASYLNGDECWWFQAAGDDGDAARRTSTSLGRWRPWRPASKPCRGPGGGGAQSWDVKDFGELRGYAPFSSFLDGDADIGEAGGAEDKGGGGSGAEAEAAAQWFLTRNAATNAWEEELASAAFDPVFHSSGCGSTTI